MSAHPDAFEKLSKAISRTKDRKIHDELLDLWLDYRDRATEWDAQGWGFEPDTWMAEERAELVKRITSSQSPVSKT